MERNQRMLVEFKESTIDIKNRIVISSDLRRKLDKEKPLFLSRGIIRAYNFLALKTDLRKDFSEMTEEEKIKEYSVIERIIDKQGRIEIPREFMIHLSNGEKSPSSILQIGGGDRIYLWHPKYHQKYEKDLIIKSKN